MMNEQDVKEFHKQLYRIDHLITQPIGDNFGSSPEFGSDAIFQRLRPDTRILISKHVLHRLRTGLILRHFQEEIPAGTDACA